MKRTATYLVFIVAMAVPAAPAAAGATRPQLESPTVRPVPGSLAGVTALLNTKPRQLASASWWGGTYAVPDGQKVSIHISTSYPQADGLVQQWVDFFAGIPHGSELSLVQVYIAPLGEVSEMCYREDVIGCYGAQTLVTVGDSTAGVPPASVATHEYGHHVAGNRSNAPWRAIDWGTKRWATTIGICSRVAAGTAFPGDESGNYSLNPGEGFAESYRVLVETGGTAVGSDWPILDPSFRPTPASLAAIREDVIHPWLAPTTKTVRAKFLRGSRIWTTQVTTPLDGDLHLLLTLPGGGADDVTLLSSDGRTMLATGSWASSGGKSVEYRVCGARSVRVRVTRGGAAARFTLQVQTP